MLPLLILAQSENAAARFEPTRDILSFSVQEFDQARRAPFYLAEEARGCVESRVLVDKFGSNYDRIIR